MCVPSGEEACHLAMVTVANPSRDPIGVGSVGLILSDRRYVPILEPMPGTINLPTILQPGQSTSYWLRHNTLEETLRAEGVRLEAVVVHLADGETKSFPIERSWKRSGEPR
jgi:hypothetical protein